MAIINYASREIELKVVYYGPAFAGKTTSLRSILRSIQRADDQSIILQTGMDQTLNFEFRPHRSPLREGFTTKLLLCTVPGHVEVNLPRQQVLRDVDGIAFVADSQWSGMERNVLAMENLSENVDKLGRRLAEVPMVIQYNKQDLSHLARIDYLDYVLNGNASPRRSTFLTTANREDEVMPCLEKLIDLISENFLREH